MNSVRGEGGRVEAKKGTENCLKKIKYFYTPLTTPLVAMALIEIAVKNVCKKMKIVNKKMETQVT